MIDRIENLFQIAVLLVCVSVALSRAIRQHSRTWTLLAFYYGCWILGDLYWLLCLIFFGATPLVSVVSDLSWYAAFILLYLLLRMTAPPGSHREKRLLPWLGLAFTLGMAAFFIQWGEYISNLVYAGLMGLLLFSSIRRLMDAQDYPAQRSLCTAILIVCMLIYGLWVSSCFMKAEVITEPYYWFDFLLTLSFVLLLPATQKAVAE